METIALLLPTRQRRDMFLNMYRSAMDTAKNPGKVIVGCYIDEDDEQTYADVEFYNLTKVIGPRIVLSQMWNKCYEEVKGEAEIFMHCGDDNIFRTEGWDEVVRNTFLEYPDRIALVWGADGNGESERNAFATHGFIHKNWVDTVGRFLPPYFVSDYNDTWLNDVAKDIGRHRFIDIMIEHMHYSIGKSEKDQNTTDRLERHEKEHPQDMYNSKAARIERKNEAEKLRKFIEDYK